MEEFELKSSKKVANTIRLGTFADIAELALVVERAYTQRDSLPLPTTANLASLEDVMADMNTPGAWTYVAVTDSRIVGLAIGYPSSEVSNITTDLKTDYLSKLMVEPEFWGRGVASALLSTIENHARQACKQHLVLWTRQANNSHTQSIYEHRGYKRTGITRNDSCHGPQFQYQIDLQNSSRLLRL